MKFKEPNTSKIDYALLLLRGAGLILLLTFGLQKIQYAIKYLSHGKSWSEYPLVGLVRHVGFPAPQVLTVFAILAESVFSLLVFLGIYTRVLSIFIGLGMIGALYTSICINDPIVSRGSAMQYILIFGILAITGPGKFSVSAYFNKNKQP